MLARLERAVPGAHPEIDRSGAWLRLRAPTAAEVDRVVAVLGGLGYSLTLVATEPPTSTTWYGTESVFELSRAEARVLARTLSDSLVRDGLDSARAGRVQEVVAQHLYESFVAGAYTRGPLIGGAIPQIRREVGDLLPPAARQALFEALDQLARADLS